MKLPTRVLLMFGALVISAGYLSSVGHAQSATPTDVSTPYPDPTVSPIATTVPIQPPNVAQVWRKSLAIMANVGQVHAVGVSTEGSSPERYAWSGDCDLPSRRVQFVIDYAPGNAANAQALATIVIGKEIWARVQRLNGTWTAWKSETHAEEFYYLLAFMLPQVCPQLFAQNLKTFPTSLLRLVRSDTISGAATWHLRGRETFKRRSYAVNAYVDQASFTWTRFIVKDVESNQAGSFSMDAQYSGFNATIDIGIPKVLSHASTVQTKVPGASVIRRDALKLIAERPLPAQY